MSECQKCKQKPVSTTQYATIALGLYMLGTSIYGTIKLFELIIGLFN
jgi:hypothetical protein